MKLGNFHNVRWDCAIFPARLLPRSQAELRPREKPSLAAGNMVCGSNSHVSQ